MDEVFDVIDKHLEKYSRMLKDDKLKIELAGLLCDDPSEIIKEYEMDLNNHASAMACLIMLKRELCGDYEY